MARLIDGSARPRWQVWRVFTTMRRDSEHGLKEVATALGCTWREILAKIESGDVEARQVKGDWMIRWPEVATLAIAKWGFGHIWAELGESGAQHLPPLVRPRQLSVTLPAYQVVMLPASRRARASPPKRSCPVTLSTSRRVAEEMEQELPGFIEAMRFPDDA